MALICTVYIFWAFFLIYRFRVQHKQKLTAPMERGGVIAALFLSKTVINHMNRKLRKLIQHDLVFGFRHFSTGDNLIFVF